MPYSKFHYRKSPGHIPYASVKTELAHLVQGVSPSVRATVQMMYASKNWSSNIQGVSPDVLLISNWSMGEGRFFTEEETELYSRVCVIGTTVKANLFGDDEDPVGKIIRLNNMTFTIVGVLNSKGANNWGQDQDDVIMAPYTSVQRYLQRSKFDNINMMNISLHTMDDLEDAKREITALLRQRHNLADYQDDDFEMRDTTEIMNTIGSVSGLMTVLLTAVAAISLLVGGIGIMNIMLVSVTERTREIAQARQIAMYLSKQHTKAPLTQIGAAIGGRNHATVLHSCKAVANLMETDKTFRHQVEEIEKLVLAK